MSGREFAVNTAFNVFSAGVPGVRAARWSSAGRHSVERMAARSFSGRSVPLMHNLTYHPYRSAARIGFNSYTVYHAASGRWAF
jgi:hypothetical protein